MASNSTKSFLADAGYGEQELDANSALMELDKGIGRSGRSVWGEVAPPCGRSRRGQKAHAPMRGAGSASALAERLDWPCSAVPEAGASKDAFDHLGAQSPYFPNSE